MSFNDEQKQYLEGYFTGLKQSGDHAVFTGHTADGLITTTPGEATSNLSDKPAEKETLYGTAFDRLCKEEKVKLEENPLDMWDRMVKLAEADEYAEGADIFRFKFHGLFNVRPAQEGYMLRCRIPGCVVNAYQMDGLAYIAEHYAGGYSHVTTRGSLQMREIPPRQTVPTIIKMREIGLTSQGSGGDNIRNITVSPVAGVDATELIDCRALAQAMHHYILNTREFYGLPRKFNIAFDGGGAISIMADTNDIGFQAVEVTRHPSLEPGVYFIPMLGGVAGHGHFATSSGILLKPSECVAFAAGVLRVFIEHGNRSNRKRARVVYAIEKLGLDKFLELVSNHLDFELNKTADAEFEARQSIDRFAHIGFHPEKDEGKQYVGVAMLVGHMTLEQMKGIADIARRYGDGNVHFTVWQNIILTGIADENVEAVKKALRELDYDYETENSISGLVACTGNTGCKLSQTDTKGVSAEIAKHLTKVSMPHPLNIVITGCPNACAQHVCSDIGMLGIKTKRDGKSVEAYNILVGGGTDLEQGMASDLFKAIPHDEVPQTLERIIRCFDQLRSENETFVEFTRRHKQEELLPLIEGISV